MYTIVYHPFCTHFFVKHFVKSTEFKSTWSSPIRYKGKPHDNRFHRSLFTYQLFSIFIQHIAIYTHILLFNTIFSSIFPELIIIFLLMDRLSLIFFSFEDFTRHPSMYICILSFAMETQQKPFKMLEYSAFPASSRTSFNLLIDRKNVNTGLKQWASRFLRIF